jgi:hypothetical protein
MEEEGGNGAAGRGRDNNCSTRAGTRSAIKDKRNAHEPHSPVAVPAKAPDPTTDSTQKTPQDITFDASQGVRYRSELEGSDARSTSAEGNEEIFKTDNPLTVVCLAYCIAIWLRS